MTAADDTALRLPQGRSVWMVSRKHPPGVGGMEVYSAQVIKEVGCLAPLTTIARNVSPLGLAWFLPVAAGRILLGLIARRVAVVHLHDAVLASLGWLARPFGVPVVVTLHGLDVCHSNPIYQLHFRSLARSFAAYVCVSRHVADLAERAGIPARRLHVVPIGVARDLHHDASGARRIDSEPGAETAAPAAAANDRSEAADSAAEGLAAALHKDAPLLLTVGRLVARKGVRWFVDEVVPALARSIPDLHYAIAGAGPEEKSIRDAIRAHGLEGRVHLLGVVSDAEKQALLNRASLVAMPNVPVRGDSEGFGVAALEAALAGCPIVAADLEGLRDSVIECRTGIRVAAEDPDAWIDTIARLLARPRLAEAIGRRARRAVVTRFDWQWIARRYCEVYRSALRGTR